jgi:hypothetical protein
MVIFPWGKTTVGDRIKGGLYKMADEPKLSEELKKMEYEPISPVEKKLIVWSLGIGIAALGFFYLLSITFFPGSH